MPESNSDHPVFTEMDVRDSQLDQPDLPEHLSISDDIRSQPGRWR